MRFRQHTIFVFFASLTFGLTTIASNRGMAADPVAWWRMDEANSGGVAIGQLVDWGTGPQTTNLTGYAFENNPTWITSGVPTDRPFADGRAIQFDALGDFMSFGHGIGNELRTTGELTLWGRIRLGYLQGASIARKASFGQVSYGISTSHQPELPDIPVRFSFSDNGSTVRQLIAPPGSYPKNDWVDIGAVFSPASAPEVSDGFARLYSDGEFVAGMRHNLTHLFDTSQPFQLATSARVDIEQFRVYNVALTTSEVRTLTVPEASTMTLIASSLLVFLGLGLRRSRRRLSSNG